MKTLALILTAFLIVILAALYCVGRNLADVDRDAIPVEEVR